MMERVFISDWMVQVILDISGGGVISFPVNAEPGDHVIEITNPVTNSVKVNKITVLPSYKVICPESVKQYTSLILTVKDYMGVLLTNTDFTLNFDGVIYDVTTDSNGQCSIFINGNSVGDKILTIQKSNGETQAYGVAIIESDYILATSDFTKVYGTSDQFSATLMDKEGNVLSNKTIVFSINGLNYNRNTYANGIANLSIRQPVGTYTITTTFTDEDTGTTITNTNTITVTSE